MNSKDVFAENLKHYMKINNKSRKDICNDLNFSYYTFTDWVNGKKYPRMDKVEMLAEYFHIKKSDLIEDKDAKSSGNTIGSLLKSLRTNNNVSLVEIAEDMHISVEEVQQYENGTKKVPLPILMAFAKYYNISFSDLTGVHIGDDEMSHTTITQNERLIRLKIKWEEEIGYNNLTDEEIDKVIEFAKFLISNRKE